MKLTQLSLIFALCLLSTACSANSSAGANQPAAKPASTASLDGVVQKDMAYADFRKAVLAKGWKPEPDAQCKANIGANKTMCGSSPALTVCTVCDQMPELSAYSDQGVVITHFKRDGQRLTVTSSGSLSDWKLSGDKSRLSISNWHVSKPGPVQHTKP